MIVETVMTRALDTRMTRDEEKWIGQVFALMCDHMDGQNKTPFLHVQEDMGARMEDFMDDKLESEVLQIFTCSCVDKIKGEPKVSKNQQDEEVQASITKKNEDDILMAGIIGGVPSIEQPTLDVNVSSCMTHTSWRKSQEKAMIVYIHSFWARATTKTHVKLGDLDELVLARIDHGSKINVGTQIVLIIPLRCSKVIKSLQK